MNTLSEAKQESLKDKHLLQEAERKADEMEKRGEVELAKTLKDKRN